MRQKYIVSREGPDNNLIIMEYAVTETKVKKPASLELPNEKFTFLGKETYENTVVAESVSNGIKSVISTIRTKNLYPIEPYAIIIAEAVITLYNSADNIPVELFFNDVDLVSLNNEAE